jgi:hypothetical protein
MNRTYTPELTPDVLDRLDAYAASFRDDFNRPRQAQWCGVYLHGLIRDGDRKSVEPMAARVPLPDGLDIAGPDRALQQFLGQSTWDERAVLDRYRATMARKFADPEAVFVIDDTTFPKQGTHSVGVQRQYCGALGKKADCQCAVSVHYVAPEGHYPLDMRLYLPASWLDDPARLARAGVPEVERRELTKGQIALELLDRVRAEGLPGRVVVADAGYGVSGPFRDGLAERGLHYVVGVTDDMVVFAEEPVWAPPGPARRPPRDRGACAGAAPSGRELAPADEPEGPRGPRPAPQGDLAGGDQGTDVGPLRLAPGLAGRRVGHGGLCRRRAGLAPDRGAGRRLLEVRLQQPAGGDEPIASRAAVAEPLAGGAGLPADEGGAGAGPPRGPLVAGLPPPCLPGDAGLRLPDAGAPSSPSGAIPAGQKGGRRADEITVPAIRRALQRLLAPVSRTDCVYCRPWLARCKTKLTE